MTVTQQPEVALPPGADSTHQHPDEWEPHEDADHPAYRCVWSQAFHQAADIRAVVVQFADGRIASEGQDAPLIYINGDDYLPDDARAVATAIVAAADLADQWVGNAPSPQAQLAAAKTAVLAAYNAFRPAPGNAGDYLRAALDSIADAAEVLQ
jgi:hypothetical protein